MGWLKNLFGGQDEERLLLPEEALAALDESEYSEAEFNEMMELYEEMLETIKQGEIVMGIVRSIHDGIVVVDIGLESEGAIPLSEFGDPPAIEEGDEIEVFLESIENQEGQVVLSKTKADFMRVWDRIKDAYDSDQIVEGRLMRRIKGGIVVDLFGVDAFLPGSQIDIKQVKNFDQFLGNVYPFRIIKLNKNRRNIVISRRVVLEEERSRLRKQIFATLEVGQVRQGSVKNITDFGAFIDLGGLDGLLHITDIAWGRVGHPSEVLSIGEEVEVKVLNYDEKRERISLGMKQLQDHPWKDVEEKYPVDSKVIGKVVSITDYGAFVELEQGVEGLVHISEMSWTQHIRHPSKLVSISDEVEVMVLRVDQEGQKISLGLKQVSPIVEMPFSCLAFKVWAVPKKPRNCDPVVLHVLEELVRGCNEDEIRKSTGLPARTLDEILDLLEDEGLAQSRMPSTQGIELTEAISRARDLNADPIRGLFASAAPPPEQYRRRHKSNHSQREYPNSWARPPFNRPAETDFLTDEAHLEILIEHIASNDQRDAWASLREDTRLRVYLRRDGPPKIEYVPVPEHWVLAGLWSKFDAVEAKPYRPDSNKLKERCRDFLMIRFIVEVADKKETKPLYFEPWTKTYWIPRSDDHPRVRERTGEVPPTPNIKGVILPRGGKITNATPDCWCKVEV